MKIKSGLFVILYTVLWANVTFSAEKNNILILNSYHKGLQWTDEIVEGIWNGLDEYANNTEIFIEYLDSKRFYDSLYYQRIVELYHKKYKHKDIKVIISSDDNALEFLLNFRDSLFGKVPVVFSGINHAHNYPKDYTGVLEKIDFVENLQLIKKLHPDYSKIYFLTDYTHTGKIIYERAKRELEPYIHDIRYEFVRDYSFDELYHKISRLDEKAILFLTAFNKDKNGVYCSYDDII
ncbi:MAG: hypothetical protein R6V16_13540, partial [Bacteroidales bacterium]